MDVLGLRGSTLTIFLLVIIFPIGIFSADRLDWSNSQWESELEIFRQKFYPDIKGGAEGPIPELVECVTNLPEGYIVCVQHECPGTVIPCSNIRKQLILNEVLLRKQFKSIDEPCDSYGTKEGDILLDPPIPDRNGGKEYITWQNGLIDSGLKFCDPFKFLRCSPLKKCTCFKDTTWVKADDQRAGLRVKDTCAVTDGNECHNVRTKYFKALSSIKLQEDMEHYVEQAKCLEGICTHFIRLFKFEETCVYDSTSERASKLEDYYRDREFRNALKLGDACDVKIHNQLVMYTEEEVKDFTLRLTNLEELKNRVPEPKYCDPGLFLTCGASSNKCECKSPSIPDKFQRCVFPPEFHFNTCELKQAMVQFMKNETIPSWVQQSVSNGLTSSFASGVVPICEGKQICLKDTKECACPATTIGGVDCAEVLTTIFSFAQVRPSSFPMDVASKEEKLKIFLEFNEKAKELEQIAFMFKDGPCNVSSNYRFEKIIGRIRLLTKPGTRMNRIDYQNLTNEITAFLLVEDTFDPTICEIGLTCQLESQRCVGETRRESVSNLFLRVNQFLKLGCGEKGCSPSPKMIDYDDIFDRTDSFGAIRLGGRANELYDEEMRKLLDMFNGEVKPRYCRLYKLDDGPFDPFRFIERCNADGICSMCSSKPDLPELTEFGGMNKTEKMGMTLSGQMNMSMGTPDKEMTKKMEEEIKQMNMNMTNLNITNIAHYNFPNQLQIISTFTTLLISNIY